MTRTSCRAGCERLLRARVQRFACAGGTARERVRWSNDEGRRIFRRRWRRVRGYHGVRARAARALAARAAVVIVCAPQRRFANSSVSASGLPSVPESAVAAGAMSNVFALCLNDTGARVCADSCVSLPLGDHRERGQGVHSFLGVRRSLPMAPYTRACSDHSTSRSVLHGVYNTASCDGITRHFWYVGIFLRRSRWRRLVGCSGVGVQCWRCNRGQRHVT